MIYLTTNNSAALRLLMRKAVLGWMVTPRQGHTAEYMQSYPIWAADNDCYNRADAFDVEEWMAWLERLRPAQAGCVFAVAPDVLGDAEATLERSRPWLPRLRAMGYAAAFVAQDGLQEPPWDDFDCLFVGGTTEWKLSEAAWRLGDAAKVRGKWWHVGRVNSWRRFEACFQAGVDSTDGTCPAWGPGANLPRVLDWLGRQEQASLLARVPRATR